MEDDTEPKRTYRVYNEISGKVEEREYIIHPIGNHGKTCECHVCRGGQIRRTR